jgi:hypothetical protein
MVSVIAAPKRMSTPASFACATSAFTIAVPRPLSKCQVLNPFGQTAKWFDKPDSEGFKPVNRIGGLIDKSPDKRRIGPPMAVVHYAFERLIAADPYFFPSHRTFCRRARP